MADMSQMMRDKLPDSAFCGRGRSFPVVTRNDIHKAVSSMGRAGSDQERAEIKSCIIRKARHNGWMSALPQEWQDELKGS